MSQDKDTTSDSSQPEGRAEKQQDAAVQSDAPNPRMAWLQVAAGFLILFNTWGMVNTFAVFQAYYEDGKPFKASSSNISWIGSIQSYALQFAGLIAGPIYDRGHLRLLLAVGSFMIVFGMMMLSLCHAYWQALLAQAFCVGIGSGLIFTPTVSLVPAWFGSNMGLAMGIVASGSSLGGVFYPIVLNRLIPRIGFGWAVRTIGFIALATFVLPLLVMKRRVKSTKSRALIDWSAFTDVPFMAFTFGLLLIFLGNCVLIFYISFYPANRHFTDTTLAFYLAAVFNAASVFGRILPNAVSDRIGVFNTMVPMAVLLGVTTLCMIPVKNKGGIIVEAIASGFCSGVVVALPPVCIRMLTDDKTMIGTRVGQCFAIAGLGLLIGAPTAGAILGKDEPLNWTGLWTYGGVIMMAGAGVVAAVRVIKGGFRMVKV